MLYLKCPTCKNILGNKQIPFENDIEKICENVSLSEEEKKKKKMELVDKYVDKYCCRMRLLTYAKLINIVK